jgi:MYXO-CTERM domain-containing protein
MVALVGLSCAVGGDVARQERALSTTPTLFLGQLDGTHTAPNIAGADTLAFPGAVAIDTSVTPYRLWVADTGNNRVLGFSDADALAAGAAADIVLGQPDLLTTTCRDASATSLCRPVGVTVDAATGDVYVADQNHHRVVQYLSPFTTDTTADVVVGQTSLTGQTPTVTVTGLTFPTALTVSGASLYVADGSSSRVLRYALPVANGASAARVFGQFNFNSSLCNRNGGSTNTTLCRPGGVLVGSDGMLFVADTGNNRVVGYASPLDADGTVATAASLLLGQPAFISAACNNAGQATTNQLCGPTGLAQSGTTLFVVDAVNDRVLGWNGPGSDVTADVVQGTDGFALAACNGGTLYTPTAATLCFDERPGSSGASGGVAVSPDGRLWVADSANSRVAYWLAASPTNSVLHGFVGQDDGLAGAPNRAAAVGVYDPHGVVFDHTVRPARAYVADTANHRVLGWSDASTLAGGAAPDLVLGQPDLDTATCSAGGTPGPGRLCLPTALAVDADGNLWVADAGFHRLMRFDDPFGSDGTADVLLGQLSYGEAACDALDHSICDPTAVTVGKDGAVFVAARSNSYAVHEFTPPFTTGEVPTRKIQTTSPALVDVRGLAADATAGALYVSDTGNNRIIIFDTVGDAPTRVLGQSLLTTSLCGDPATPQTLCAPRGIDLAPDGTLLVADAGNNRVLAYLDVATATSGRAAAVVVGQPDFIEDECNRDGLVTPDGLCGPSSVASDQGGSVLIADTENQRIVLYSANRAPTLAPIDRTATVGVPVVITLSASDPDGDGVTLLTQNLPSFLIASPNSDGTLTLAGTPGAGDVGVTDVIVQATDDGTPSRSADDNFLVTVEPAVPDAGLSDAGPTGSDGGTIPRPDGGMTGGGGDGGCSVGSRSDGGEAPWLAGLLLAALWLARRRR